MAIVVLPFNTRKKCKRQIPEDIINEQVMPSSSYMLREKEYEASKARTTPFDVHCKSLLEYFGLRQAVYDGYFSDQNGILICFDAKLASFGDG